MSAMDPRALRDAFASFPTGVTVVTARDAGGRPVGFTASSFSSVSLAPPLLLVCPARSLSSFAVFERCRHFAVNVLAEGQEDVSNTFAGFKGDRFARVRWRADVGGRPLIEGAAAQFSCETASVVPAGDHVVLIGAVRGFTHSGARGLGYAGRQYFSLGLEREAAAAPRPGRRAIAGAIVEHDGHVLLEETSEGLRPPQMELASRAQVRSALGEWLARSGLDVELGKAYSIFDDRVSRAHFTYFVASAANDRAGALGRYLPIAALARERFVSPAHATMLARFATEYETRAFGLYVGDEAGGDVHSIDGGR